MLISSARSFSFTVRSSSGVRSLGRSIPGISTNKVSLFTTSRTTSIATANQFLRCFSTATPSNNDKKGSKSSKKVEEAPPQLTLDEIRQVRIDKVNRLQSVGVNPYAYTFHSTHTSQEIHQLCESLQSGQEDTNTTVSLAGRIMIRRVFGKLAFFSLQDTHGSIQLYIDRSKLGIEAFEQIKDLSDAGDIIGVTGTIKRTEKGEPSINVHHWEMLTKSLHPLPDKYHGFTDINKRYRLRHLDMIANPTVRQTLISRNLIMKEIRNYLDKRDFIEIETPILQNQPGGAEAKPFETYHNTLHLSLTLRIATELHLKRLIVSGFDKVYEIGRIFRNEGLSTRHNPEFTSIELYQAYVDYHEMMKITEDIVVQAAEKLNEKGWLHTPEKEKKAEGSEDNNTPLTSTTAVGVPVERESKRLKIIYQGQEIDLTPPWKRISMIDIVKESTGIDFYPFLLSKDYAKAYEIATKELHISPELLHKKETVGEIINVIFEEKCESTLQQPTFITNHPIDISPLAKPHRSLPGLTERFELFIVGREHANAFSELTDPIDQRARFNVQVIFCLI